MTDISKFTYLPNSKSEREAFVALCVEEITSGNSNPLDIELMLKNLEETISAVRKHPEVKETILAEAQNYPEKTFKFKGATITKTQRSAYDFSACNDSLYNSLVSDSEALKTKIKEREAFLKTLKPEMNIADAETGEMLLPPSVLITESLTIKLP